MLVNEAVNLGIAIYDMRRGEGNRHEPLVRDETVGALDDGNGKEYVRMLSRAIDLGRFHQVICICYMLQVNNQPPAGPTDVRWSIPRTYNTRTNFSCSSKE